METLPYSLETEIFSTLPLKSICHSKSVCKAWYNSINRPSTLKRHLHYPLKIVDTLRFYHDSCSRYIDKPLEALYAFVTVVAQCLLKDEDEEVDMDFTTDSLPLVFHTVHPLITSLCQIFSETHCELNRFPIQLPNDVELQIHKRLPLHTIGKLYLACKLWNVALREKEFVKELLLTSEQKVLISFGTMWSKEIQIFYGDHLQEHELCFTPDLWSDQKCIKLRAEYGGLVVMVDVLTNEYFLWNPLTCVTCPLRNPIKEDCLAMGISFKSESTNVALLCFNASNMPYHPCAFLLTYDDPVWREITSPPLILTVLSETATLHESGDSYWLVSIPDGVDQPTYVHVEDQVIFSGQERRIVLKFSFASQTFTKISCTDGSGGDLVGLYDDYLSPVLDIVGDSLHLLCKSGHSVISSTLAIYTCEISQTVWTFSRMIGPFFSPRPLRFVIDGNFLLLITKRTLSLQCPDSAKLLDLPVKEDECSPVQTLLYRESLLLMPDLEEEESHTSQPSFPDFEAVSLFCR